MHIIKKRLKNSLNNKIIQKQLTFYTIFYIILNPSQKIIPTFKIKKLTKLLFIKNLNLLKKNSFIYPICYISAKNTNQLLKKYLNLQQHSDFNKLLICNLKLNFLIFKNINLIKYYSMHNNLILFYKTYFLINTLLLNFNLVKNIKLLN